MIPINLENLSGKKVLITGGLGFIGSNLAIKCVELGAEVTLLSRSDKNIKNIKSIQDKVKLIFADITDKSILDKAVLDKDIIFHLAGQTSGITSMEQPIMDIDINLIGTMNLLEACREYSPATKIVFTGTATQLGRPRSLPINEEMKDSPLNIYAANKLIAEKYLRIYHKAYGLDTTSIRLPTIYGERQQLTSPRFGITNFFIGRILRNEVINVYNGGKFIRDYLHISDVISALILSAQKKESTGETFLIGTNKKTFFIDMVKEVVNATEEVFGKKGTIQFVEFPKEHKKADSGDILVDYSKIKKLLGWEPKITLKEGIRKTVKFYECCYKDYL